MAVPKRKKSHSRTKLRQKLSLTGLFHKKDSSKVLFNLCSSCKKTYIRVHHVCPLCYVPKS